MPQSRTFFVGRPEEVAHHAAPLAAQLAYEIAEPHVVVARARPGDVAVFYSEHFDRFRQACQQLKKKQVATLYMIDGILEWRNAWENRPDEPACPYAMRPVLSHKAACIGPSQARILRSWGNELKVAITGVPRFDCLPRSADPELKPPADVFRVMVATAKTPAFTEVQLQRVIASLSDLKSWFERNPSVGGRRIEIVWRLTGDLDRHLEVGNRLGDLSGIEIANLLPNVDCVITTASTLMLEAMLYDVPVCLLDYHNSPAYLASAWTIGCAGHIPDVIASLADPTPAKMVFQRTQLNDALYLQSPASTRFSQLVSQMQQVAAQQLASNQPLVFPANLLPPIEPLCDQSVDYDHSQVFPELRELTTCDREELRAQLAHSRREIEHLKSRLAIRESELAHAHQIFDRANRHPIVGRILKLRRKLNTLTQALRSRPQPAHESLRPEPPPVK